MRPPTTWQAPLPIGFQATLCSHSFGGTNSSGSTPSSTSKKLTMKGADEHWNGCTDSGDFTITRTITLQICILDNGILHASHGRFPFLYISRPSTLTTNLKHFTIVHTFHLEWTKLECPYGLWIFWQLNLFLEFWFPRKQVAMISVIPEKKTCHWNHRKDGRRRANTWHGFLGLIIVCFRA